MFLTWDRDAFNWFCNDAGAHYANHNAVGEWLDQVLDRITDGTITLAELVQVQALRSPEWEHPNYASNRAYKAMERWGKVPVGLASY